MIRKSPSFLQQQLVQRSQKMAKPDLQMHSCMKSTSYDPELTEIKRSKNR